ncbi:MAG TPA: PAS domain-containing protein, partial [Caulobacteraceae bacterium]
MTLALLAMTMIGLALVALGGFALAARARRRGGGETAAEGPSPETCLDVFGTCLIAFDGDQVTLVAGRESLEALSVSLGVDGVRAVVDGLAGRDPRLRDKLTALRAGGEAFELETANGLAVAGRPAGVLALLRLSATHGGPAAHLDTLAGFVSERPEPCWIADADGAPVWVNRAWLTTVGAQSLADARERGLSLDGEADRIALEAVRTGETRAILRWVRMGGERRALRFRAQPLETGAGVWSEDVTEAESAAARLGGQEAAQEAIFDLVADAIAVFDSEGRLSFHNLAFASLWYL